MESWDFPGGSDGKETACNAGDLGLIPGSGSFLGEGNGYPFQYSHLENSIDRGHWQAPSCILGSWPFQIPYRLHVQVSLSCCFHLRLGQWETFSKTLRGERYFFSTSCLVLWAGCSGILSGCHSLQAALFHASIFNWASVEMLLLFLSLCFYW